MIDLTFRTAVPWNFAFATTFQNNSHITVVVTRILRRLFLTEVAIIHQMMPCIPIRLIDAVFVFWLVFTNSFVTTILPM
jgi:hypothetical protein